QVKIQKIFSALFPEVQDIFIGSFIKLHEPARQILFALAHLKNIHITFGVDHEKNNSSLFALQEDFVAKAMQQNFTLTSSKEKNATGISQFRRTLRTSFFQESEPRIKNNSASVHSFEAATMKDELRFTAKMIKHLIVN